VRNIVGINKNGGIALNIAHNNILVVLMEVVVYD
jgi:hypothetical protein